MATWYNVGMEVFYNLLTIESMSMLHGVIAFLFMAAGLVFGYHQEVATSVAAFYVGREHAQAEYRIIYTNYGGKRANAPWWCGFEPSSWDLKSITDFSVPLLIAITSFFI